jgi:ATP-dependent DNA ligase
LFFLFDLLYVDGEDVIAIERTARLATLLVPEPGFPTLKRLIEIFGPSA